ncbi:rod shape-determining protein RodA [Candidatus Falkowbacteria bacterium RBG_13_39_14]|uniref:Rod shape-determining protein RodA n=1 Tax=Candidatus Falkowbacteria bacterium RBG_13_39_14 TaxID=1797985 RepID=A0A1F5S789_9BACT|nr:MAG: rod shape-determining protein RodA [Candidatus Falkowbacteria bacterium RBG_13_39_14]
MFKKLFSYLKKFDWITLIIVIFFISLGLMSIYGISLGSGETNLLSFRKQIIFAVCGIILVFIISSFDYKALKTYAVWVYGASTALLLGVLALGKIVRGTKGWFELYGLRFQPVELAKIFLIIILAKYFSGKIYETKKFSHIAVSGVIALLSILPTMLQPDLGSAAILFFIWLGMLLLFGAKKRYLIAIFAILISAAAFSFAALKNYQKDRIYTFLDPSRDPLGKGYNITQSLIAIGSGRLKGKGLGSGTQTQLKFLPETKTDFIFSVIAEEMGFGIIILIFIGWIILLYRLLRLAKLSSNSFAAFLTLGISIFLFVHFFVNVGVSTGILPVTGIPLPFMSYGGSFLITCLISIGIIESIALRTKSSASNIKSGFNEIN